MKGTYCHHPDMPHIRTRVAFSIPHTHTRTHNDSQRSIGSEVVSDLLRKERMHRYARIRIQCARNKTNDDDDA